MKKILAVVLSFVLVIACGVTAFASGEISMAYADFDPATITDMLSGLDISSLTGALDGLDLSAITGLFDGLDLTTITNLFDSIDLSSLTDILGGIDIGSLIGGDKTTAEAPETTTIPVDEPSTDEPATTNSNNDNTTEPATQAVDNGNQTDVVKTGDSGMAVAASICGLAGVAFVLMSKKKEA